ncbi:MAG: type VI secretion system baseplate subunit TssK [Gemmatimonadaceae bacterium]
MRQMQPVLWTKGVLLSPQHLQTQDRFLEDLLHFQLTALTVAPWGFRRLELDREALAGGTLAISAASGIFPDGLLFDFPGADMAPPPKALDDCWGPDQVTLGVYLTVPEYRDGGYNVSTAARDRNTRFLAEVLLRRDENTGLAEKPIQVARKNLRLLVEGEALEGNARLPVARVRRAASGGYELDAHFVPPLVDVQASDYLTGMLRRQVEILSARSTALAGTRRQKNQSLADFSITDVANFWLLYTVNTHLPGLRHIYETGRAHPAVAYQAMAALAGALTTFSTRLHPREIPLYDHAAPGPVFTELDSMLRELLETVVPTNVVSLPLRRLSGQSTIHATALDDDRYLAAPQLFLAVSAGLPPHELAQRVPHAIKVSAADSLDRLIRQALAGMAVSYVPSPPPAIPVKLNHHYFRLDQAGVDWQAVQRARNLAVYVPEELPDAQLELVIVLPPRG